MGKHKSKEVDEERILRKIRRLERKLRSPIKNGSNESSVGSVVCDDQPEAEPEQQTSVPSKESITDEELVPAIPEEFLTALGEEGVVKEEEGLPINAELASRWTKIIATGFTREALLTIHKKYPIPNNLTRAVAPILNPELAAAMSEAAIKRDRRIIYRQNNLSKVLTCLGSALSDILKGNINSINLIERISDAAKLTAYTLHQDTQSRKFFALAGANKDVQTATKNTSTDEFLFGKDLVEKIRSAHSIQVTSQKIKKPEKKNLNFKTPPLQKNPPRPRGGQWPTSQPARPRRDAPHWNYQENKSYKRQAPSRKPNRRRY